VFSLEYYIHCNKAEEAPPNGVHKPREYYPSERAGIKIAMLLLIACVSYAVIPLAEDGHGDFVKYIEREGKYEPIHDQRG